jgi:5-methylthioadenosine/S-adenosylhomocysteine deaminase
MATLLIRNARLNGKSADLRVEDGVFKQIAAHIDAPADRVLDAAGKIIVPPFYNTHTHAAMTLLRGYADDMELHPWLNDYIWPAEARLTADDVYHGTRLAILEMVRTGTVFFNDMYWFPEAALRAVEEMGVRAALGRLFIEGSPGKILERNVASTAALEAAHRVSPARDRIRLTFAPHAVYTVSGATLRDVAARSEATGDFIHASETRREVEDCLKATGQTPVAWLDECGVLGPRTLLAHCVHLTPDDIARIHDRGAVVAHMPCSNYKLVSGQFDFDAVYERGHCRLSLGTDGCASNNSLSMFGEMKLAALSAKMRSGRPTCGRDTDILRIATRGGAEAFGIGGGIIAEGFDADALLLDSDNSLLVPEHNLAANLVYSADSSCVDTVLCAGRILMENRRIDREREILETARDCARRIVQRG